MKKTVLLVALAIAIGWCYSTLAIAENDKDNPVGAIIKEGDKNSAGNYKPDKDKIHRDKKDKEKKGDEFNSLWYMNLPPFVKWYIMNKYDTNDNGILDENERTQLKADWKTYREAMEARREANRAEFIEKWDTDNDGKLSEAEKQEARRQIEAAQQARREQEMLRRFDKDGDGKLSDAERQVMENRLEQQRKKRLSRFDFDRDGKLEGNEKWALEHRQEIRRWIMRLYDADMDARLNDAERAQLKADLEEFYREMHQKHGAEKMEKMSDSDYWKSFQDWQEKRHEQQKFRKEEHKKGELNKNPDKGEKR